MKTTRHSSLKPISQAIKGIVIAASLGLAASPVAATPVTWDDIANDHMTTNNVLMYGMGTNAQRYSPLNQVNADNVFKLTPAWTFSFGDEKQRGQESQAIVHDGVIYVTGSYSRMFALDAKTGRRLWSYSHRLPDDIRPCCDVVNRGAAIYGDLVFFGTLDASVVALNKDTGKVVWREKFADHKAGYTMTGAPTIVQDQTTGRALLIHGSSGDEFGVVGKLFARDPLTGEEIWMRPFVEGHMGRLNGEDSTPTGDIKAPSWPDDPNSPTGKVEAWSQGGGAPWQSASFDAATNTIIIGAGNPAPWNGWARTPEDGNPADYDSLYTSGQVGVDPSTGEVKWFYQHTPNDTWDFPNSNQWPSDWVSDIEVSEKDDGENPNMWPGMAWLPYLLLALLLVLSRLPSLPFQDALRSFSIEWPEIFGTTVSASTTPLYLPGTILILVVGITALLHRMSGRALKNAFVDSTRVLLGAGVVLIFTVPMVRVYINSGVNAAELASMPLEMAGFVADTVGGIWPLFAGITGALGAFIGGANTVSNLMFSAFQHGVATRLAISSSMVVAIQAVGGAAGNMIAIHNVVAASATVGLLGREGATLRKTILPALYYMILIGVLGLIAVYVLRVPGPLWAG